MKILVLLPEAFGGQGGIAQYDRDLLTALASHPSVTLVTALPRSIAEPIGGLPARVEYVTYAARGKPAYLFAEIAVLMRRHWYDLIICAHIRLLPLVTLLRLRKRVPVGLVLYGIDAWEAMGGVLTRQALRKLDWCAAITNITMERFLSWSRIAPARTFVIHNAVDIRRYSVGLRRADLSARHGLSGRTVLMTLGRLNSTERYKGIDEVLEILPLLLAKRPEIMYLVCGEGTDRKRLEEKARSLGIREHVVFTGYIDEAEKIDYYRLADCFILAGWGEGFGFALIEAMACGVPVVGSCLDGSREALGNGELGVVVDPRNSSELLRGIETALAKTPGRVPAGLDRFSYDTFEEKVHQLIVEPTLR